MPTTAILLGSDTPIGLSIVRDLGRHGHTVVAIGWSRNTLGGASRYCRHHEVRADGGEDALIAQIVDLAKRFQATCILAISEGDLLTFNRRRAELETVLRVLTPTSGLLAQVLDKPTCQTHAEAVGMRTPRTLQPTTMEDVRSAAAALTYPVVLKWADPNVAFPVLSAAGLTLCRTDYAETPRTLMEKMAPFDGLGMFPMIQEYCPGHGLGHMFLAKDGEILIEFQHERVHEWPPEGGVSSLCRAVPLSENADALARSRALIRRLRWTGVAMVEYRFDPNSRSYAFMEVNGRFWGSLPLAIAAGLPFAAGLVAACGQDRPVPDFRRDYPALSCIYGIPETRRLVRLLFQRRRIQDPLYRPKPLQALVEYVTRPLRPSTRYYVLQLSDVKPFLTDLANVAAKFRKGVFGSG